jgi:hypothetical protein
VQFSRRFVFLLFLQLYAAAQAVGQETERRGFIGLDIGPSAPIGKFSDAATNDALSGRATPGYTSTLFNVGYFGRPLGISGSLSYSEYVMDGGGDDDWWQVAFFTIGPMYSRHLNARAAVDLKAMFGLAALTPVIDSYTTNDGTASGLAVDLRIALRYDVFRRWAVFAEGGLQTSRTKFSSDARTNYSALISGLGVAFRPAW